MTGRRFLPGLGKVFGGDHGPVETVQTSSAVLDHYIAGFPSLQNAIDAVPGWVGAMPAETGLKAGNAPLHVDSRIVWLVNECFPVAGKSVLELGPLEAFHTHILHQAGAAEIDAVDANALAFFRCLITKEALKLTRANFFLGDFMKWLEETDKRYDLVVASGVLYHSDDPVRLLELISERADSFYLWTHYFDNVAMPRGDHRRVPFSGRVETKQCRGVTVRLHERSYHQAWRNPAFCGGIQDRHFWIDREDVLALISAFGFDRIKLADEQPDHVNGPAFSIFAQRTPVPAETSTNAEPIEPTDAQPPVVAQTEIEGAAAELVSNPPDLHGEIQPAPVENTGAETDPDPASLPPRDGQV